MTRSGGAASGLSALQVWPPSSLRYSWSSVEASRVGLRSTRPRCDAPGPPPTGRRRPASFGPRSGAVPRDQQPLVEAQPEQGLIRRRSAATVQPRSAGWRAGRRSRAPSCPSASRRAMPRRCRPATSTSPAGSRQQRQPEDEARRLGERLPRLRPPSSERRSSPAGRDHDGLAVGGDRDGRDAAIGELGTGEKRGASRRRSGSRPSASVPANSTRPRRSCGEIASTWTAGSVRPRFTSRQERPPLRERYSALAVPTKTFRSWAKRGEKASASAVRSSSPSWHRPSPCRRRRIGGRHPGRSRQRWSESRAKTGDAATVSTSPSTACRQLAPASIEMQRPVRPATNSVRSVAKSGEAAMASARAGPGSGLTERQTRASSERKTPAGVTARTGRALSVLHHDQPADGPPFEGSDTLPAHADAASSGRASGPPRACS